MAVVKLCGIKSEEDAALMNEVKPDYVGFVFAPGKHQISAASACRLSNIIRYSRLVGVFVNEQPAVIAKIAKQTGLDVIQLHGDEDDEYIREVRHKTGKEIWKAVRVRTAKDIQAAQELPTDKLLLDSFSEESYGGTGKVMDFAVLDQAEIRKPYFIAGGLTVDNLPVILRNTEPYGIDISSGIETGGVKDREKMRKVIQLCKRRKA